VFSVSFGAPWVLLGLPLLLLLPRGRTWLGRFLTLVLLLLALAQPSLERPSREVAVLVDVSESVGENGLEALQAFDLGGVQRSFYAFAGDVVPLGRTPPEGEQTGAAGPERTDLARALQVAAASGAGRVLLLSDGAQSVGDALAALPEIPVDTFRVRSRSNVRLTRLLAPEEANPGETVEVIAVVESDREAEVTLRPSVNGEPLPPIRRRVTSGRTAIPFTLRGAAQDLSVEASLEVTYAQPTQDDTQRTLIAVTEEAPVLVVNDPAVAELLEVQGFLVRRGTPADVTTPLNYSAIILRESVSPFTPGQLELLRSYVEGGGGLMMTGGPESFGLGAWYRTPVEAVLPVNTDLRTEVELPLVALVIVLDRSQSMSTGSPTKLDLAKEGAIGVLELAYARDLLGLITFSDQSEWVFRPRQATEQGKREMLEAVLNIEPQGGTILEPAYREALRALRESEAAIKHVIVLSDGRFSDGGGPFSSGPGFDFSVLAAAGRGSGITTSTIAIGDSADTEGLRNIAAAGGGRYYEALDVSTLPRIFTNEALTATRSLLREGPLQPRHRAHPLAPDLPPAPRVNAYVASTLKAEGEVILEGWEGEPILAVSRQGLGRSAALTTDLNTCAGAFGAWEALPGVLGTVTRWLQVRPAEYSAVTTRDEGGLKVVVDAVRNGEYVNGERLTARYEGEETDLEQVAPGRYEGRLETPAVGGTVVVSSGGEVVARSPVEVPSGEFNTEGASVLLQEIAARTGGQIIEEAGRYAPPMPPQETPIWPPLALAGFGVFLLELIARRFMRA